MAVLNNVSTGMCGCPDGFMLGREHWQSWRQARGAAPSSAVLLGAQPAGGCRCSQRGQSRQIPRAGRSRFRHRSAISRLAAQVACHACPADQRRRLSQPATAEIPGPQPEVGRPYINHPHHPPAHSFTHIATSAPTTLNPPTPPTPAMRRGCAVRCHAAAAAPILLCSSNCSGWHDSVPVNHPPTPLHNPPTLIKRPCHHPSPLSPLCRAAGMCGPARPPWQEWPRRCAGGGPRRHQLHNRIPAGQQLCTKPELLPRCHCCSRTFTATCKGPQTGSELVVGGSSKSGGLASALASYVWGQLCPAPACNKDTQEAPTAALFPHLCRTCCRWRPGTPQTSASTTSRGRLPVRAPRALLPVLLQVEPSQQGYTHRRMFKAARTGACSGLRVQLPLRGYALCPLHAPTVRCTRLPAGRPARRRPEWLCLDVDGLF